MPLQGGLIINRHVFFGVLKWIIIIHIYKRAQLITDIQCVLYYVYIYIRLFVWFDYIFDVLWNMRFSFHLALHSWIQELAAVQLQRFSRGFLARRRVKEKRQQQRPLGDQGELGIAGWNPCKKMVNLGHLGAWSTNYHFLCVFFGGVVPIIIGHWKATGLL